MNRGSNSEHKPRIFLCHASEDKPHVLDLYHQLKTAGYYPWLDKKDLLPGQNWQQEIEKIISDPYNLVVVCLSRHSVTKRGVVQKEIKRALDVLEGMPEDTIYLIPARLEPCEVPNRLSNLHWVDLFEPNGFEDLTRALDFEIRKQASPPPSRPEPVLDSPSPNPPVPLAVPRPADSWFRERRVRWIGGSLLAALIGLTLILFVIGNWAGPFWFSLGTSSDLFPEPNGGLAADATSPSLTLTNAPSQIITAANGTTMALIPAGQFEMGSDPVQVQAECQKLRKSQSACPRTEFEDEWPLQTVTLDAFYIDRYEVTNAHYAACVEAGVCDPPVQTSSATRENYYGNADYDDYPVIHVSWEQARVYCEWRGARQPTEAEWEKAARGTDGRLYPWGNTFDGRRANFCDRNCPEPHANMDYDDGHADTAPVGFYANGTSPYNLHDMAGNVAEWVADWYAKEYYRQAPVINPPGPISGENRLRRGGSWGDSGDRVRTALRQPISELFLPTSDDGGFRCARDLNKE